jgi:Fur family transcriptional regulator, ferric uptake regulator
MQPRNTRTKQLVLDQFKNSSLPLNLQEVYSTVKIEQPTIAYSTVFRIVRNLAEQKKLIQIDWKERGSRYEWAEHKHHHHLVCNSCNNVSDIDDEELKLNIDEISKKTGFVITDHSLELFGMCKPCKTSL